VFHSESDTMFVKCYFFFFSSRRRHTRFSRDWSSDVCSSDLQRIMSFRNILQLPVLLFLGTEKIKAAFLIFTVYTVTVYIVFNDARDTAGVICYRLGAVFSKFAYYPVIGFIKKIIDMCGGSASGPKTDIFLLQHQTVFPPLLKFQCQRESCNTCTYNYSIKEFLFYW